LIAGDFNIGRMRSEVWWITDELSVYCATDAKAGNCRHHDNDWPGEFFAA